MHMTKKKKEKKERKKHLKKKKHSRGDTTFAQPRMRGEISIANTCTKFAQTPPKIANRTVSCDFTTPDFGIAYLEVCRKDCSHNLPN